VLDGEGLEEFATAAALVAMGGAWLAGVAATAVSAEAGVDGTAWVLALLAVVAGSGEGSLDGS
jgi:hypothetical protein